MTTPVSIWAPAFLEFHSQKGAGWAPDPKGVKYEQLKNVMPEPADLPATPKFSVKQLTPDFIFSSFPQGTFCKLCEEHSISNREAHYAQHMKELRQWLAAKQAGQAEANRFFPKPCEQCGEQIPKKRGRQPKLCAKCKDPARPAKV